MINGKNKKNNIALEDYNYRVDIVKRLFLSRCSQEEIEILQEIIFGPLKCTVSSFAKQMGMQEAPLLNTLYRLEELGLYKVNEGQIVVDKEARRQLEVELERFSEDHEVNLSFVKSLFSRVPVDLLLNWYVIPRHSSDIFSSLIERFILTPRVYERYLLEIQFEEPKLTQIIDLLFGNEELTLSFNQVKEQFNLSEEELHEILLHLEFNLIAFLSVKNNELVIVPFAEWQKMILQSRRAVPKTISANATSLGDPFAYINRLATALEEIDESRPQQKEIIDTLLSLDLLIPLDHEVMISEEGRQFLEKGSAERALYLLRHPSKQWTKEGSLNTSWIQREVETALKVLEETPGWVSFDALVKSIDIPLKGHSNVELVRQGIKWSYSIPQYTDNERREVASFFKERLWPAAVMEMGELNGIELVRLTDFGKKFIQ